MPLGRGVDNCASSLLSASHFGLPEPIWVYTQCACVARAFTYLSGWGPPGRWLARLGVCFTGSGARSWPGLRLRIPLHKVKKPYPHLLWQEDRVKPAREHQNAPWTVGSHSLVWWIRCLPDLKPPQGILPAVGRFASAMVALPPHTAYTRPTQNVCCPSG